MSLSIREVEARLRRRADSEAFRKDVMAQRAKLGDVVAPEPTRPTRQEILNREAEGYFPEL